MSEISERIDELHDSKSNVRRFARNRLSDLLIPDGRVAPEASDHVAKLVDVACDPDVEDREGVIILLADLAAGGAHPTLLFDGVYPSESADLPASARRATEETESHFDEISALLNDRRAAVRAATALLLGMLPRRRTAGLDACRGALTTERNASARASLGIAIGLMSDDGDASIEPLEGALRDGDPLAALGAACGLAYATRELHRGAVDEILDALEEEREAPDSFPWWGGRVRRVATHALVHHCRRVGRGDVLHELTERCPKSRMGAALAVALFPHEREQLRLPDELDDFERQALLAVARCNTHQDSLFRVLNRRGFQTDERSLVRYAGGTEPGPLDTEIAGKPAWAHFRAAVDGRLPVGELQELLADLSAEDVAALCDDAVAGYMCLHLPFPRMFGGGALQLQDFRSRLYELCVILLVARVPASTLVERLNTLLENVEQTPQGVAAIWLAAWTRLAAPPSDEAWKFAPLFERAHRIGAASVLREFIESLDLDRRKELVLPLGVACVDDRGSGSFVFHGALPYLDLIVDEDGARLAIEGLVERPRPAIARIIEILGAIGEPAREVVSGTLERSDLDPAVRAELDSLILSR